MFAAKFLVPAVVAAGLASAASSSTSATACASATNTISSAADATALASACSTVDGTVELASSVSGDIVLDGIEQILGGLNVTGAVNLTSLSGSDLNSIGGTFTLIDLTIMSTLQFNTLTSVGEIYWETLNALEFLTMADEISTADSVTISDTQLNSLDGINLDTVSTIDINNNLELKNISTQIANVTGSLTIDANNADLILDLPNLIFAYNMTLRNISTISLPSLASINTTLGFYGDYVETISAPNLTNVGGDLAIVANADLTNISMPELATIGSSLQIANNTKLLTIDLPKLVSTGAVDLTGNFTELDLPELSNVTGAFYAVSSGNFSCTAFKEDKTDGVIAGSYTCTAGSTDVQEEGSSSSSTSSSSSSSSTSSSSASNVYVNTGLLAIGGLAGLVSLAL